jgi:preprotein translocase subunit SecG
MYALIVVIHIAVALFLIVVILLQGGRGGLGEALGGGAAQSLFGGGANVVMTKITAGVAAVFMGTSLVLAALSTARGRSVIDQLPAEAIPASLPLPEAIPAETIPSEAIPAELLPAEESPAEAVQEAPPAKETPSAEPASPAEETPPVPASQ